MDLESAGIRINQIYPTWVKTPMFEEECRRIPQMPQIVERLSSLKRAIEPDEVVLAYLYLCSLSAVYINGVSLTLDSGLISGAVIG